MMNVKSKKVSLLIPVYGVERFIERCARSLFEQTFENIEYIFVDDCTQDASLSILLNIIKKYPNRHDNILILKHDVNKGLSAARNTAVRAATGYYIMHVDSDDYLELDAVEAFYDTASSTGADIVVSDNNCIYIDRTVVTRQVIPDGKEEYIKLLLSKDIQPSIWGKFFVRDLYLRSNVQSIEGLNYGEDYVVTPKLAYYANKIVKISKPLYNYVLFNEESYTKNISSKSIQDLIWANDSLNDFFSSITDKDKYIDALILSKLRTQTYLLKHSNADLWGNIISIYPDLENSHYLLTLSDRILLKLAIQKNHLLLKAYISLQYLIKRIIL